MTKTVTPGTILLKTGETKTDTVEETPPARSHWSALLTTRACSKGPGAPTIVSVGHLSLDFGDVCPPSSFEGISWDVKNTPPITWIMTNLTRSRLTATGYYIDVLISP